MLKSSLILGGGGYDAEKDHRAWEAILQIDKIVGENSQCVLPAISSAPNGWPNFQASEVAVSLRSFFLR
jgi:hypothetical protein